MAKLDIQAGATSISLGVFIQDSSSTTGAGLTGLVFNTAGLTCYAVVPGSSSAAITLATLAAANSAYSSGGFKEIDSTNMGGWYRLDVPNTNISTGRSVGIHLKGATNMAPLPFELSLTAINNQSTGFGLLNASANVVQINSVSTSSVTTVSAVQGTTIAPTFTGSLIKCDVTDWNATAVSAPATAGIPEVNIKNINNVSASAVTTIKAVQGLTTADTVVTVSGNVNGNVGGNVTGSVGSVVGSVGSVTGAVGSVTGNVGGNVVGSVASVVGAVASVTGNVGGNVTGSVGSVVGAVGSVTGNVGGNVTGTVASVVDISTTTLAESAAVPAATATPLVKLNWMATIARNKITQTATTQLVRNDGDAGTIGTSTVSDDGTTFTRGKFS